MGNECVRLHPDVLEDLYRSTQFSVEEIRNWYKVFLRDFPRGEINIEEFKKMYQGFYPNGDSSRIAGHLFRCHDTNRDGVIDFTEFLINVSNNFHGTLEKRLRWLFTLYDIDGNGYISPAEMREIITSILKANTSSTRLRELNKKLRKYVAYVFRLLDIDSDGKITLSEFLEMLKNDRSLIKFLTSRAMHLHRYL